MKKLAMFALLGALWLSLANVSHAMQEHIGQVSAIYPAENRLMVAINSYYFDRQRVQVVSAETGAQLSLQNIGVDQWVAVYYEFDPAIAGNRATKIAIYRGEPEVKYEH